MKEQKRIIIVGGGFAGLGCAQKLARQKDMHITLIDKNNYHEFTPLLYQVATSQLTSENVATTFRHYFEGKSTIDIKMANVISVDPKTQSVKTEDGQTYQGDYLVLAAGSVVNFFNTKGAEQNSFPLYTLNDAERLRSRILAVFEAADRNPKLIDQGALNFVIVGAGPTGTETAGALGGMLHNSLPREFTDLAVSKACIYLVDHNPHLLAAFSEKSQSYAAQVLTKRSIQFKLGLLVKEVGEDHVLLSDGNKILARTIIWAGGLKAAGLADACGMTCGHGGRINVLSDLTVEGYPNIYALGDFANVLGPDNKLLPQLASVAQQSGYWAAKNIIASLKGEARTPFKYDDKGIMAMIGKDAAVVEIGEKRRELTGTFAFLTWLLVHATLLPTFHQKFKAFLDWIWTYFSPGELQILDRKDVTHIDWKE